MGCTSSVETKEKGQVAKPPVPKPAAPKAAKGGVIDDDEEVQYEVESKGVDENGDVKNIYDRKAKPKRDKELYGGQFMAVQPWLGALKAPTEPPEFVADPPKQTLALEYVYGYRAIDSRQNLFYTVDPKKVVYMTAAVGVVLNKEENTQQFFGGGDIETTEAHNDDITSLAISADRKLVATGQVGKDPDICIWSAETCELISRFDQGKDTRAVKAIGFSNDGQFIAAVGSDDDHTVAVFDLQGTKIASGGPDPILDISWSKTEPNVFATAGKRGVIFWTLDDELTNKKGLFGSAKMESMSSVAFGPDGKCYSGSTDGALYVWEDRKCVNTTQVTTGLINSIVSTGEKIIVGGKDVITTFDLELNQLGTIPVPAQVRSLDTDGANILAGLRDGSIIEFSAEGTSKVLLQSHSDGEAWGLAICPKTGLIVTSCDDNKVMVWDPEARICVGTAIVNETPGPKKKIGGASTLSLFPPNQQSRAVAINPANGHLAVGVNNGGVHIHSDLQTLQQIKRIHHSNEWIEAMQYSPDGKKLAIGSHDNCIYIHETENYELIATMKSHNAFITALDWSSDSQYIQSVCGAYELLFSLAETGTQETDGATLLRDEPWSSFTTKLGWPVQGIFPPGTNGGHINGVDRSKGKELIATADDLGLLNIYRNPCLEGGKARSYRAHSEHVVRARFDNQDARLYTIGGYDRTLMQWRLV